MSRGGRGGGRGGFGGGLGGPGTRGGMEISTGTLTREDLQETAGNQEHGVLYPVSTSYFAPSAREPLIWSSACRQRYDRLQHPHMPTDEERRICQYTRDLLQDMRSSPYRLEDKVQKNGERKTRLFFVKYLIACSYKKSKITRISTDRKPT